MGTALLGLLLPSLAVTEVEPTTLLEIVTVQMLASTGILHVAGEKTPGSVFTDFSKVMVSGAPVPLVVVLLNESRKVTVSVAESVPFASTVLLLVARSKLFKSASPAIKFTIAGEPFADVMLKLVGVPLLNATEAVILAVPIAVLLT